MNNNWNCCPCQDRMKLTSEIMPMYIEIVNRKKIPSAIDNYKPIR